MERKASVVHQMSLEGLKAMRGGLLPLGGVEGPMPHVQRSVLGGEGVLFYSNVQCIMRNGHMNSMLDRHENITFPQIVWRSVNTDMM